jgi:hypothetical protein
MSGRASMPLDWPSQAGLAVLGGATGRAGEPQGLRVRHGALA